MDIQYRQLRRGDYNQIKHIICEAWEYDKEVHDQKTLSRVLDAYLYDYLSQSNHTMVATVDGNIAGFLFGRCNNRSIPHRLALYLRYLWALLRLTLTHDGRMELHMLQIIIRTDRSLLRDRQKTYDGELVLFAMDSKYRCHGIGRELEARFQQYMMESGAANFYVYTDTYSNYHFYDDHGFRLVSEKNVNWNDDEIKEPMAPRFFLYAYNLK